MTNQKVHQWTKTPTFLVICNNQQKPAPENTGELWKPVEQHLIDQHLMNHINVLKEVLFDLKNKEGKPFHSFTMERAVMLLKWLGILIVEEGSINFKVEPQNLITLPQVISLVQIWEEEYFTPFLTIQVAENFLANNPDILFVIRLSSTKELEITCTYCYVEGQTHEIGNRRFSLEDGKIKFDYVRLLKEKTNEFKEMTFFEFVEAITKELQPKRNSLLYIQKNERVSVVNSSKNYRKMVGGKYLLVKEKLKS